MSAILVNKMYSELKMESQLGENHRSVIIYCKQNITEDK